MNGSSSCTGLPVDNALSEKAERIKNIKQITDKF